MKPRFNFLAMLAALAARVGILEQGGGGSGGAPLQPARYGLAVQNANQGINGSVWTRVDLNRISETDNGAMSANGYLVPADGLYLVSAGVVFLGGSGTPVNAAIRKNGTEILKIGEDNIYSGSLALTSSGTLKLKAGDLLQVFAYAVGGATIYGSNDGDVTTFSVNSVTVSAPPQVFARVTNHSNQAFNGGVWTRVEMSDVTHPAGGAMVPGRFTAPVAGIYLLSAQLSWTAVPAGAALATALKVNDQFRFFPAGQTANAGDSIVSGAVSLQLNAGDYVEFHARANPNATSYGGPEADYATLTAVLL